VVGGDRILVLNAGSSSLKMGLFDGTATQVAAAQVAWAPDAEGSRRALREIVAGIDLGRIVAIGHRVVHGGTRFTTAVTIDGSVQAEIEALSALAPLHNRPALAVIAEAARLLPGIPQVAVFDTAFHATLPPAAYLYAVPYAWYEQWGVRRFGFHGLSHAYCAMRASELLGQPAARLKLVTCHLGSGCSLAAIAGGVSIATTMGFTPLDGLVMATRPGAVDPGVLTFVLGGERLTLPELEQALYRQSGLLGISGRSGDMRDILAARAAGDPRATVAFDLYVTRLREGIAAMASALGGIDALVFTGGVGEHAPEVRAAACARSEWFGLALDNAANAATTADGQIAAADSRVRALVIHTREELMVARETVQVLRQEPGPVWRPRPDNGEDRGRKS
jgi:acetate kinase